MIYDRELTICNLTSGTLMQGKLEPVSVHLYGRKEVYYRRYWESVLAGSQIDLLAELPGGEDISAHQFAVLEDGHTYRIEQAQHGENRDGLPICTLSLRRMGGNYDIAGI